MINQSTQSKVINYPYCLILQSIPMTTASLILKMCYKNIIMKKYFMFLIISHMIATSPPFGHPIKPKDKDYFSLCFK